MTIIRPVEHTVGGNVMRGTAYLPGGHAGRAPAVVLHHGFGSTRLEAFGLFVQISRALAERGICAVAFDRAGHGESDGEFFDTSVSGDVAAGVALVEEISGWPTVDAGNIHLLGMSLGSVVASVIAAETPIDIASLTLLSPAAVFVDELRGGTLQGRSTAGVLADGYFDFNGSRLGPAFFADARDFDVYGRARGFLGEVRIIHGAQDDFVPMEYARRYVEVYGDRAHLSLPDGDHMWSSVSVREPLLREVIDFLERQVAARAASLARVTGR